MMKATHPTKKQILTIRDIIFGQSQDEIWPEGFFDNAQQG